MLKLSHLRVFPAKTSLALAFLLVGLSLVSSHSFADSTATTGMGIRLTIIPATNIQSPQLQNPFSTVESALQSDELNRLELDSTVLGDFSDGVENGSSESPAEMISRLEQAVNSLPSDTLNSLDNQPVVFTVSAG